MSFKAGEIPSVGMTNQQKDFILAITTVLEKYGSEGTGDATFEKVVDELISETVRLDYALRAVGSGGPGMERSHAFRNLLRNLKGLLSRPKATLDASAILRKMHDIGDTASGLKTALRDYIGITFNEKLMESLDELEETLKHYYEGKNFLRTEGLSLQSTAQLEQDLIASFSSLRTHLRKFVDEDIRTIKSVQSNSTQGYVNLTVIATFLSGVTASVLQIVGPTTSGRSALAVAVNASLFSSLIFSTASAAQSLLAMMWMQSFVRLPEKNLPHLLYAWLHRGPLISLLVSGALFAVGLVVFVFSSEQDPVTSVMTACFATLQTFGILSLTFLFIRERWRFRRDGGVTGQKLTKFSILFSSLEGIERIYKYAFSPSQHPSMQGVSYMPTYDSEFSTERPAGDSGGRVQLELDRSPSFVPPTLDYQPYPTALPRGFIPASSANDAHRYGLRPVQERPSLGRTRTQSLEKAKSKGPVKFSVPSRLPRTDSSERREPIPGPIPASSTSGQELQHFRRGERKKRNNQGDGKTLPVTPAAKQAEIRETSPAARNLTVSALDLPEPKSPVTTSFVEMQHFNRLRAGRPAAPRLSSATK